jgi:hypothetical protein
MAYQTVEGWSCSDCKTVYKTIQEAKKCEAEHDTVYVKFQREDLERLIQFLYTKDESLLTKTLVATLMKYRSWRKGNA